MYRRLRLAFWFIGLLAAGLLALFGVWLLRLPNWAMIVLQWMISALMVGTFWLVRDRSDRAARERSDRNAA